MPTVINFKTADEASLGRAILVDRTTKWGNPFRVRPGRTRAMAIAAYREWLTGRNDEHGLLDDLGELRGRDLACHCAPRACHADVLLELANA